MSVSDVLADRVIEEYENKAENKIQLEKYYTMLKVYFI
jgi:hypothetical protein